jgi:hypothetical protein
MTVREYLKEELSYAFKKKHEYWEARDFASAAYWKGVLDFVEGMLIKLGDKEIEE